MRYFNIISGILLYCLICGHTVFEKTSGQKDCYEEGVSVVETHEGNYLLSAAYNCTGNSSGWNSYLALIDQQGDSIWTKKDLKVNGKVKATNDGHFVFAGGNTAGFVYDTIQFFKSTAEGDVIWKKSIFYPQCKNSVSDILPISDGFLITGFYSNQSCSNPVYNSFILKLNLNGNQVWEHIVNGPGNDQIQSVRQLKNGDIAAFGWTDSKTQGGNVDYLLVKLTANGSPIWSKNYGDETDNFGYGFEISENNGFILTGYSAEMQVHKLDGDGNIIWIRSYNPSCGGRYFQVKVTSDGGYTFLGSEFTNNNCKSLLMKTDVNGVILWKKLFDGKLREFYESSDSSFVLIGYISYLPDLYVIKFDSTKMIPRNTNVVAIKPAERIRIWHLLDSLGFSTSIHEEADEIIKPVVYPNPVQEHFTISFYNPSREPYNIEIFDLNGKRVFVRSNYRGNKLMLERATIQKGMHTYKLTGTGNIYCGKLLFN